MTTGFATLPPGAAERVVLTRASVPLTLLATPGQTTPGDFIAGPDGCALVDILIENGTIAAIRPALDGYFSDDIPVFGMDTGMVLPGFVDMHTHLDKGHIWPRQANPDGSFMGALQAVGADREAHWSADDLRARMDFALRCAYAHGTVAIRTHLDSIPPQDAVSWPVFEEMRDKWAGRIELQAAALCVVDSAGDADFIASIADRVAKARGVLGAVTYMVDDLDRHLDTLFRAASERNLDLDFHVDETHDPDARSLRAIAEAATRNRYEGQIVCGHCCSLARQDDDEADRTLDLVAKAGIAVVSLPMCNMYLQDRATPLERNAPRTPRWRGVTLVHEMAQRGIPVSFASDNTRDPFYAFGDLDMLEVYTQATRIAHLDHPVADWPKAVTATPADVLRTASRGRLAVGANADLVLFRARTWSELFARPQSERSVLRAGRIIDRTLPDYRELDSILGHSR